MPDVHLVQKAYIEGKSIPLFPPPFYAHFPLLFEILEKSFFPLFFFGLPKRFPPPALRASKTLLKKRSFEKEIFEHYSKN